jgi:hypothetical protein
MKTPDAALPPSRIDRTTVPRPSSLILRSLLLLPAYSLGNAPALYHDRLIAQLPCGHVPRLVRRHRPLPPARRPPFFLGPPRRCPRLPYHHRVAARDPHDRCAPGWQLAADEGVQDLPLEPGHPQQ